MLMWQLLVLLLLSSSPRLIHGGEGQKNHFNLANPLRLRVPFVKGTDIKHNFDVNIGDGIPQTLRKFCDGHNISALYNEVYDIIHASFSKTFNQNNVVPVPFPKFKQAPTPTNVVSIDATVGSVQYTFVSPSNPQEVPSADIFQLKPNDLVFKEVYIRCQKYSADASVCDDVLQYVVSQLQAVTIDPVLQVVMPKHQLINNFTAIKNTLNDMKQMTNKHIKSLIEKLPTKIQPFGLMVLPHQQVAMCIIPKCGCTTLKNIITAMLGFPPHDLCQYYEDMHYHLSALHAVFEVAFPLLDGIHIDEMLFTASYNEDDEQAQRVQSLLVDVFGDHEYKSIAFVRDPWARAISAFHQELPAYNPAIDALFKDQQQQSNASLHAEALSDAFFVYHSSDLDHTSDNPIFFHSVPQTQHCGLAHLKYDHYLDIKDKFKQLPSILSGRMVSPVTTHSLSSEVETADIPAAEVLSAGWEKCTVGNKSSILEASFKSPHFSAHSFNYWNQIYCTQRNVDLILKKYKVDYEVLGPLMNYTAPICP